MSDTFDFETLWDRRGHDALAVDAIGGGSAWSAVPSAPEDGYSSIPMWVADMGFAAAPSVIRAMRERLDHPLFGYFAPSQAYYNAIIRWQRDRNDVEGLSARDIGYENGVLGCVSAAVQAFTAPGEAVLLHSPTYIGFSRTLANTGRRAELSPLVRDSDGVWRMDFDDMDRRLKKGHIHLAVFCSPHNPCGRVWERWELERAAEIFRANDCAVISDEIWSDILLDGHRHIPFQSVSEDARNRTIAVYAPSKTFNLAGLVGSYHIIYNPTLRDRVRAVAAASHYNEMNVLSMHALIGAYSDEGARWTDALCDVLSRNVRDFADALEQACPKASFFRPQGTYMLFVDFTDYCARTGRTQRQILAAGHRVGIGWQDGEEFFGPCSIRVNLAQPHSLIMEAAGRLPLVFA